MLRMVHVTASNVNFLASRIVRYIQAARRSGEIYLPQNDPYGGYHGGCDRMDSLIPRFEMEHGIIIAPKEYHYLCLETAVVEAVNNKGRFEE